MLKVLLLVGSVGLRAAGPGDSVRAPAADTVAVRAPAPTVLLRRPALFGPAAPPSRPDTPTVRPVAVEHSDAYYTRLAIHRYASYAMLPVFVGQYLAGRQLMDKSADAPAWARNGHRALATATLVLFGVNTVTGSMNWWEARSDPEDHTRRTIHAATMLLADAGFSAVGLMANAAETNGNIRSLHKQIAIGSMGVSVASWVMMLPIFHRN
jgi:hypothetical protein